MVNGVVSNGHVLPSTSFNLYLCVLDGSTMRYIQDTFVFDSHSRCIKCFSLLSWCRYTTAARIGTCKRGCYIQWLDIQPVWACLGVYNHLHWVPVYVQRQALKRWQSLTDTTMETTLVHTYPPSTHISKTRLGGHGQAINSTLVDINLCNAGTILRYSDRLKCSDRLKSLQ